MKKLAVFAIAVVMCLGMMAQADAQPTFRVGGGFIFDGSQPGGGVAIDLPMSDKPYGITIAAEYYKKSGVSTVPVRGLAMYQAPAGETANFYFGVGGGLIYSKVSIAGVSASTTKGLASGVAGLKFSVSESMGFYGEVGYDRAVTSGAKNLLSARAGISFGGSE